MGTETGDEETGGTKEMKKDCECIVLNIAQREEALNSMMDEDEGTVFALVFEARLAMLFINSKGLYDEWLQYCKKHRSEAIDRLNKMVMKLLPHKEKPHLQQKVLVLLGQGDKEEM